MKKMLLELFPELAGELEKLEQHKQVIQLDKKTNHFLKFALAVQSDLPQEAQYQARSAMLSAGVSLQELEEVLKMVIPEDDVEYKEWKKLLTGKAELQ